MSWVKGWVTVLRFLLAWVWTLAFSLGACVLAVIIGPTRAWVWSRVLWARVTLALIGVRIHIRGAEHLNQPAMFIANHQSLIDVVLLPALLPKTTRFVGKKELLWIPLWGWFYGMGGALLIDRKNTRRARTSLRKGLERLPAGWSLVVFPEGTRSFDGELLPFKSGAFHLAHEAGLPLVPIGLAGVRSIVPADGWLVRGGDVFVHVGPALHSPQEALRDTRRRVSDGRDAVLACVQAARVDELEHVRRLSHAHKPA